MMKTKLVITSVLLGILVPLLAAEMPKTISGKIQKTVLRSKDW